MLRIAVLCLVVASCLASPIDHGHGHHDEHHGEHHKKHGCGCGHQKDTSPSYAHPGWYGRSGHYSSRIDSLEMRMAKVATQLDAFDHKIDEDREATEEVIEGAKELLLRVELLEGSKCPNDQFSCRLPIFGQFTEDKCINHLLVCDGHKDCTNGWDEDEFVCLIRAPSGSIWKAEMHGKDECTTRKPSTISIMVNKVERDNEYTGHPHMEFTVTLEYDSRDGDHTVETIHTDGYYDFAHGSMTLLPPEDDRLGLVCYFDGIHDNRCHGGVIREATLDICAAFEMTRIDAH